MELSIGKFRGLQQCSTARAAIAVMALDHRNNLRNALNPAQPELVSDAALSAFKVEVVKKVGAEASAVLLDPEVGAAQCVAAGALGYQGLLVAVEATGYAGSAADRQSRILPGWSVQKARRMGASAVKLLVYYHPDTPAAADIEALVKQTAAECKQEDIPLFLEPLSYSSDPNMKKLLPAERRRVVLETARRLTIDGVDILKAEFPVDVSAESNEYEWGAACRELSQASRVPWVLLSAAVEYDTYLRQVRIACESGASGVAVGRAVWQEAANFSGEARANFLHEVAAPRMRRLTELCDALAQPWRVFYQPPAANAAWYQTYMA